MTAARSGRRPPKSRPTPTRRDRERARRAAEQRARRQWVALAALVAVLFVVAAVGFGAVVPDFGHRPLTIHR